MDRIVTAGYTTRRYPLYAILWIATFAVAEGEVAPAVTPETLIRCGAFKRARAIVEQRFHLNPNVAESLWMMSWIKQIWGDRTAALAFAEKAVNLNGKDARFHLRLAEVLGESAKKANLVEQLGFATRFKKEIATTLALDPNNVQALRHQLEFCLLAPPIAGGDRAKANALADMIMRIDPVEGYFAQAWIARHDRQEERLERLFRSAVEAGPSNYEAHIALGNYYRSPAVKKFEAAASQGRIALGLDPSRIDAYCLLAAVLALQWNWSGLEALLVQSEKNVPDNLTPYYRAAEACVEANREFERAERYIRKYLSIETEPYAPSHAQARWLLGQAIEKQGRTGVVSLIPLAKEN